MKAFLSVTVALVLFMGIMNMTVLAQAPAPPQAPPPGVSGDVDPLLDDEGMDEFSLDDFGDDIEADDLSEDELSALLKAEEALMSGVEDEPTDDLLIAEEPFVPRSAELIVLEEAPVVPEDDLLTMPEDEALVVPEDLDAGAEGRGLLDIETARPAEALETDLIDLEMVQEESPTLDKKTVEDLITISLDDVPIQDVIRMFTRISGANIVAGTNLQGNVTVSLQDVEWEPALRVILDTVDLAMVERDQGIYGIVSKNDLVSEPVTVDTLFLNYTTVTNILPIVKKMLVSTNASVSGFPSANAIIVQETANRLGKIKETVRRLDIPRRQVFIEAKFVELNDQAIKDLGINWEVLQGYTVGAGNLAWSYEENREWVKSRGTTSERWDKRNQLDALDRVYDIYGIEYQDGSSEYEEVPPDSGNFILVKEDTPTRTYNDNIDLGQNIQQNIADTFSKTVGDMRTAVLSADQFQLTLSALKQNSGADVVSNPKIIVASGETATLHVGRRDPILKRSTESDVKTVTYEFDRYQDSGVELQVTPIVHTVDEISMEIIPELSRVLGYANSGDANIQIPVLSSRRIKSQFNLASGKTAAIGGLTETTEKEQINKVPLLGDIPLIGKYLFTHTHEEKVQDEIIIFVTVEVAKAQDLREESGIPTGGRLIHQQLIREKANRQGAM